MLYSQCACEVTKVLQSIKMNNFGNNPSNINNNESRTNNAIININLNKQLSGKYHYLPLFLFLYIINYIKMKIVHNNIIPFGYSKYINIFLFFL